MYNINRGLSNLRVYQISDNSKSSQQKIKRPDSSCDENMPDNASDIIKEWKNKIRILSIGEIKNFVAR